MKKYTRNITSIGLGVLTVSSIALTLHFNSLNEDYVQAQEKLNVKYTEVLNENEELRGMNIDLADKNMVYKDESTKLSGLVEQSQMEIERLKKESETLQKKTDSLQIDHESLVKENSALSKEKSSLESKVTTYQTKVDDLEKKLKSAP